jgi:site-specific recombinase XerD
VLAIPPKRTDRAIVCFLTISEIDALLAAPDRATWLGRRDHTLLLPACQTGLRVSELTSLSCGKGAGDLLGLVSRELAAGFQPACRQRISRA